MLIKLANATETGRKLFSVSEWIENGNLYVRNLCIFLMHLKRKNCLFFFEPSALDISNSRRTKHTSNGRESKHTADVHETDMRALEYFMSPLREVRFQQIFVMISGSGGSASKPILGSR